MRGSLITSVYVLACLVYIFWSDALVFYLVPDLEQTRTAQTIKGAIFVLVTGGLLAYLIARQNRRQEKARVELERALQESRDLSSQLQEAVETIRDSHDSLEKQSADLKRSNEDLVQFAYVVSHDLREPLRMVSSYLQLLQRRYESELDDDAREFIHFAVDGAQRMQKQIQSLLEYSRLNTHGNPFDDVDLNDVVADVLQNLNLSLNEKNVELSVGELPHVRGDRTQLAILIQNLVNNALKHGLPRDRRPRIEIQCNEEEDCYRCQVEDNGEGFDPKFADRVFEIFQRLGREEEGTGIGLALCRRIVQRHQGNIWAETEPGKGTRIIFTLPRRRPKPKG